MKILIADSNRVFRRMVEVTLAKWGYEVIVASDGAEAWKTLQAGNAPPVAILSWEMPVMSGTDICRKLRGATAETYIYLILLAEEESDVIAGLDSGADTCLTKPIDWKELKAQLKVAERIIGYHCRLQQYIQTLVPLVEHDNLIREQGVSAGASEPTSSSDYQLDKLRPILEIDQLLPRVFAEMGVGSASAIDPATFKGMENAELVAWSALIFRQPGVWLEIKMEIDRESTKVLFQTLAGSPASSDEELLDTLAETLNIFQGYFKATFDEEDVDVISPIVPKAMFKKNLPDQLSQGTASSACREYAYSLPGIKVRLTLIEQPSPVVRKTAFELSLFDVLVDPLESPKNKEVTILNPGVIFSASYIEKLQKLAASGKHDVSLSVVEASPLVKALFLQQQN